MAGDANRAGRQALVGLGTNLGDRAATLTRALDRLRSVGGIIRVDASSAYETDPVGYTEQPPFLNAVAAVETTLAPEALLGELQRIEQEFGRTRIVRWGPRTLDLDLLAYEGETRDTSALTVPHPRMFSRAFVLVPLRELLAQERFHARWAELRRAAEAANVDTAGVRRVGA